MLHRAPKGASLDRCLGNASGAIVRDCVHRLIGQDYGLGIYRLAHLLDALDTLDLAKTHRIVSVGHGQGNHEVLLAALFPHIQIVAVDITEHPFPHALPNLTSICGDITDPATQAALGGADCVYSIECLEHIEQDRQAFAAMAALLAPGGTLYLQVPFATAAEQADAHLCQHEFENYGHFLPGYRPEQLVEYARAAGLVCDAVANVFWSPLQPMLSATLEKCGADPLLPHADALLDLVKWDFKERMAAHRGEAVGIKLLAHKV